MEKEGQLHFTEMKNTMSLLMSMCKVPEGTEEKLTELKTVLTYINPQTIVEIQNFLVVSLNTVLNRIYDTSQEKKLKRLVTEILEIYLGKTEIGSLKIFFFIYNFLLGEIYDRQQHNSVAKIEEEYKLSIMQSMILLTKALTWEAAQQLYTRENALALCQMLYVTIEMAKSEQFRSLRCAAIECIMSLAKVDGTVEVSDIEIRNQIADVFIFFAPGIISGLGAIAIEDEKHGHKIALLAIRAWGRIVALQMQDYNASDNPISGVFVDPQLASSLPQSKWANKEEVKEYLEKKQRNPAWYKSTDEKLKGMVASIAKLTCHSHAKVRFELAQSCLLLIQFCSTTIPDTVSKIIEIVIILSEDDDKEVANISNQVLSTFPSQFTTVAFKKVFENLEDNFFTAITALPRIFTGLDDQEQLSSLNLLIGYFRLFGLTNLAQLLHSATHLQRLIQTLIHTCELEQKDVSLYEEYMIQDLELVADRRTPWKNFRYFREDAIKVKLETACALLTQPDTLDMISDLLLDIFINNEGNRKEATLILNNVISGLSEHHIDDNIHVIKHIVNIYLDPEYWNLPLEVSPSCMMPQVQNNIIQICLQLEGLSGIALAMKEKFKPFLLKALYPVLERAGSGQPLIKTAGIASIVNISVACGYANVTELINTNSDYFSFHVINKIHKIEENESVLNVLATVMRYSNIDVLSSISEIVSGVLLQTCDKFFQEYVANAYLRLFHMFIKSLIRWLCVEVNIEPIKSKSQKEAEHEDFFISNITSKEEPSDDKEKDAENWKQDENEDYDETDNNLKLHKLMQITKLEIKKVFKDRDPNENEYIKPEPPNHISLAVKILQRSLHFLPSKDRTRKLLVLDILIDGLEVIRDWENELLPLIHQIWSPLVERFKEKDDMLIINRSFQLLVTMARLSREFIRSRVTKEVLPGILTILKDLSSSSYLQDKGSAYRYTQAYKLQLNILKQLADVVINLDVADNYFEITIDTVMVYMSNKQPSHLQVAAVGFYKHLAMFDRKLVHSKLVGILENESKLAKSEYKNNVELLLQTNL